MPGGNSPRPRGRRGLAALALSAAAAVPVVVALTQSELPLERPGPRAIASSGGDTAAAAAASGHDAADEAARAFQGTWQLSRVLADALQRAQQLVAAIGGGAEQEAAGGDWEAADEGEEALEESSSSSGSGSGGAAAAGATQHAAALRQRPRWSARRLAVEHPEEAALMRGLALAELPRLLAEAAAAEAAAAAPPPPKRRWRSKQPAPAPEQLPLAAEAAAAAAPPAASIEAAAAGPEELLQRFTDAELFRFALLNGLPRSQTPAQRAAALRAGAAAAARTALWQRQHLFSTEAELARFAHLASWQGTDAEGRPILRISLAQAVNECHGGEALAFANAAITLMAQGVSQLLRDADPPPVSPRSSASAAGAGGSAGGGADAGMDAPAGQRAQQQQAQQAQQEDEAAWGRRPDTIVLLMDCRGGRALDAARISWVFKAVAVAMSHHFPARLHELVLLDLPVVLGWMVQGVKALVHPDTRGKFRVVKAGEAAPAAYRSVARQAQAPPPRAGQQQAQAQAQAQAQQSQAQQHALPQQPEAEQEGSAGGEEEEQQQRPPQRQRAPGPLRQWPAAPAGPPP